MLQGTAVCLCPLRHEDTDILFRWINDRELVRWNAPFKPVSYRDHCEWFSKIQNDPARLAFGIRLSESDRLIGLIQLIGIDQTHRSAELRIKLCDRECFGQGIGTEALRILLEFAWKKLNLNRVSLSVFASNGRAIRAYERVGFRAEGRRRKAALIEGSWLDIIEMGILRDEALSERDSDRWRGFTEEAYRSMLDLASTQGYRFTAYEDTPSGRHVLWRHDIDLSVHRAVRLATIETAKGMVSTYFVNPHSAFYNMMEPAILRRLRQIRSLGHYIGLHFDADAYPKERWTHEKLEARLAEEQNLLSNAIGCPVPAFSYHNPDVGNLLAFDDDHLAGMVNAYSARLRGDYVYASDSNGYWRFKSIPEVLQEGHERLHILTHPGWWTPDPMAPRERVERCAMGRAQAVLLDYDEGLAQHGRLNVGAK